MKLVIDRSKWYRGQSGEESKLIRGSDGKMCCLGFLGMACGAADSLTNGETGDAGICNQAYPSRPRQAFWPEWLWEKTDDDDRRAWNRAWVRDLFIVDLLANVNDDVFISDTMREAVIADVMGRRDVEVVFIDGPQ